MHLEHIRSGTPRIAAHRGPWVVALLLAGCSGSDAPADAPAGGVADAAPVDAAAAPTATVRSIALLTNDLVLDPTRQRLYVSVPSRAGAIGNSVVTIDPEAGAITGSIFVGSEPGALAISDDAQALYVAIDGASSFRRIDLATGTAAPLISVGNGEFGPRVVSHMAVMPGAPRTVVVAISRSQLASGLDELVVYDDEVARPNPWSGPDGGEVLVFGDPSTVYSYQDESSRFNLTELGVEAAGLRARRSVEAELTGFTTTFRYDRGWLIASTGRVVDAASLTVAGQFDAAGPFTVDPSGSPVHFLVVPPVPTESDRNPRLLSFERTTFRPIGAVVVPVIGSFADRSPKNLVEWSAARFAFRTSTTVYLVQLPSG